MPTPKDLLIRLLQNAHAGELAAFHAYDGHAKSLRSPTERAELLKIQKEEWEHRESVGGLLRDLGSGPRDSRERLMKCVGLTISFLCRVGGWFIPMYGAGRLERGNIVEYEIAAAFARDAGYPKMVPPLLEMAVVEWEHERYFDRKCREHFLSRVFPMWSTPEKPLLVLRDARVDA